ncbi:MAG: glycosyltransferase [Methylococcaceae bacterium]|nr:glycosyltransferase [Methylococcaceae bacterium]
MTDILSMLVVIPVHNEEDVIATTVNDIIKQLATINIHHNLVLIDDGSSDESWAKINEIAKNQSSTITAIKLSRNFGKDAAILAGLTSRTSDLYVVIDADGEHPVEKINEFYQCYIDNNCDVVHGVKNKRRGSWSYKLHTKLFNKIFNSLTNIDLTESSDFKLFNKKFRNALLDYGDYDYFFRAAAQDVGFNSNIVTFDEKERLEGSSSWGKSSLIKYALNSIVNYSHYPLYLILFMGLSSVALGFGVGIKVLFELGKSVIPSGYLTLLILSLISIGMIMTSIGIIGVYLSKIFDEVKRRPRYIVETSTNDDS